MKIISVLSVLSVFCLLSGCGTTAESNAAREHQVNSSVMGGVFSPY